MSSKPNIRVHNWINTETMQPMYGLQFRGMGKWWHLAENGEALLFETIEAAEAKATEVRARPFPKEQDNGKA